MRIHEGNLQTLPASIPEVQTFTRITQEFPAEGTTARVVVKAPAADRVEVGQALRQLDREAISSDDFVGSGRHHVGAGAGDAVRRVGPEGRRSDHLAAYPPRPDSTR